jgi:hypothetical protein
MSQTAAAPAPQPRPAAPPPQPARKPDPNEARFAALERQIKAQGETIKAQAQELDRLKSHHAEATFSSSLASFEARGKAFVDWLARSGRILPRQRQAVYGEYKQAAQDDLKYPTEVHFSAEDGAPAKGTRVQALEARYRALESNRLTEELVPDREGPEAEFSNNTGGPGKADPATVRSLLAAGEIGRTVLAAREAQKNGRG